MKPKKNIKTFIYLFSVIISFLVILRTQCVKVTTIDKAVTAKAYDRATGNLYLGLDIFPLTGEETNAAIIKLPRYNGYGNPEFQTVVASTDTYISDQPIEFLTLSTEQCNTIPYLVTVPSSDDKQTQTQLSIYSSNLVNEPTKKDQSEPLIDAGGKDITAGIISIAASNTHAFAAIKENGGVFGAGNSGIALVKIEKDDTISLVQTDAQNGSGTIKRAQLVNETTPELIITGENIGTDILVSDPSATLYWDEKLQRLYIGMSGLKTSVDTEQNAGIRSIIVARVEPTTQTCRKIPTSDRLLFQAIAPNTAFEKKDSTVSNQIVGIIHESSETPTAFIAGVHNLRVMHTSTKKHYLIINGGIQENDTNTTSPGNLIFALPLVYDPTQTNTHGTLADINNPTFMDPAKNPGDLYRSNDQEALVGVGPLPLFPDSEITDIVVVGDTVFVSTDTDQGLNTDPGIFYSQAQFDENGVIYRWSPWSKRAYPFYAATNGKIKFFDVDAANGKIWAIDAIATNSIVVTNWSRQTDGGLQDQLLERINCDFCDGAFSALDLDRSTRGLGESSPARYFLIGGCEKVAFIRTSTSYATKSRYDYDYVPTTSQDNVLIESCCDFDTTGRSYEDIPVTSLDYPETCCDFVISSHIDSCCSFVVTPYEIGEETYYSITAPCCDFSYLTNNPNDRPDPGDQYCCHIPTSYYTVTAPCTDFSYITTDPEELPKEGDYFCGPVTVPVTHIDYITQTHYIVTAPCCNFSSITDDPSVASAYEGLETCCDYFELETYSLTERLFDRDVPYGQFVIDNFEKPQDECDPTNYILTKLPRGAGCVKVLEYARRSNEEDEEYEDNLGTNYFFAGTQTGLYIFAQAGTNGFKISDSVDELDMPPFRDGKWVKAPNINGAVIDIKSSGNALYVLTFQTSAQTPLKNKLYKIEFDTTVENMFNSENIFTIAESAISNLSNAKMFFAIQVVTTSFGTKEQLLLATNNGIYNTNAPDDNGICNAQNQEDAKWTMVDKNDTAMYTHMFAIDNTNPDFPNDLSSSAVTTVWPVQVADENDCLTFGKNVIRQLSGSKIADDFTHTFTFRYNPENFVSTGSPCKANEYCYYCESPPYCQEIDKFKSYNPITYFWSDGARRFFVIKRIYDPNWVNKLYVIPYDIKEWMIEDPETQELTDPELKQVETFYWIKMLGINGTLLAGTDSGVITLQ